MSHRQEIWELLLKDGGKTSTELRALFPVSKDRATRVLREMLLRGYLRRDQAGRNNKRVMTYRYFANEDNPPIGKGHYERKERLRVRVIGERQGYAFKAVQASSKTRQATAMRNIACFPVVRLSA